MFVNEKEIQKLNAYYENVNFPTQFCLGSVSNGFIAVDSGEVSSKGNVYDFSVGYIAIIKPDILNI